MIYMILCGGKYDKWQKPRQLKPLMGEPLVARTIRLLKEAGVDEEDITISADDPDFEAFGVPVLNHFNRYQVTEGGVVGDWVNAFITPGCPICYIFGDVVFSPEAIKTIVETPTADFEFFASAPPFAENYKKPWAEPFAIKVVDFLKFEAAIQETKELTEKGYFRRPPIMWELWQVLKGTPLNIIDYTNFCIINDYTCDIDGPEDAAFFEEVIHEIINNNSGI